MTATPTTGFRWTIADLALFESDRANRHEIIDGELFVTRAPTWQHQTVCINIGTLLKLWSDKSGLGEVAFTPGIIFSESDNVIPDLVWVSHKKLKELLDQAGHLTGAPELVIEVLSPGDKNQQRDTDAKRKLYSAQGAKEYWIVDFQRQVVAVYRREKAVLKLVVTLYGEDELTSPLLPDFKCLIGEFF